MQTESRGASWLASYAEVQLILCKDNANREHRCKLACKLCRGAAYLMQRYKLIRYIKKTFLVIMAKEIKINKRLIIDGKEQGCDLLKIHYLCGDKDN